MIQADTLERVDPTHLEERRRELALILSGKKPTYHFKEEGEGGLIQARFHSQTSVQQIKEIGIQLLKKSLREGYLFLKGKRGIPIQKKYLLLLMGVLTLGVLGELFYLGKVILESRSVVVPPPIEEIQVSQPPPVKKEAPTHTMQKGETFYHVSHRYNISVEELIKANPNLVPERIWVGQKIRIPTHATGD